MSEDPSARYSNYINPATGQYIQLDPTKTSAEYIKDESMKYVKDNYIKDLTPNIYTMLSNDKATFRTDPATGIIYYRLPGDIVEKTIDPKDTRNTYVQDAIRGYARQLITDPNPQITKFVLPSKEQRGRGVGTDEDLATQFLTDLYGNQFFKQTTVTGREQGVTTSKEGGTGEKDTPPAEPYVNQKALTVNQVNTPKYTEYENFNKTVNDNSYETPGTTKVPVRRASDIKNILGADAEVAIDSTPEGGVINFKGQPYTTTESLDTDLLGRSNEGSLQTEGAVTWKYRKEGDLLIPEIESMDLKYTDGTPVDIAVYNRVKASVQAKQQKTINDFKDREVVNNKIINEHYNQFKLGKNNSVQSKVGEAWINDNYNINRVTAEYTDKKTGKIIPFSEVSTKYKEFESTASPEEIKSIIAKGTFDKDIADKVTKDYFSEGSASVNIFSFYRGGDQTTATQAGTPSQFEADFQAALGKWNVNSEGKVTTYTGSKLKRDNALGAAWVIDPTTGTAKSLASIGITGKDDYDKYQMEIMHEGFGFEANGTGYFYGTLVSHNPTGTAGDRDRGDKVNGKTIRYPMSTFEEDSRKFAQYLGMNSSENTYASILGTVIMANKSGTIENIDNKYPWVANSKKITYNRPDTPPEGDRGGRSRITVSFDKVPELVKQNFSGFVQGNTVVYEAADGGDAGRFLYQLNQFSKALGAGGSSGLGEQIK